MKYIRVGTEYYKFVKKPSIDGSTVDMITKWSINTLKRDKVDLDTIPKYDAFTKLNIDVPNFFSIHNYKKIRDHSFGGKTAKISYIKID